jgi:hypothetical protein
MSRVWKGLFWAVPQCLHNRDLYTPMRILLLIVSHVFQRVVARLRTSLERDDLAACGSAVRVPVTPPCDESRHR